MQYDLYFFCNLSIESQLSAINYKISYQESKNLQKSVITSLFDNVIAITLIARQIGTGFFFLRDAGLRVDPDEIFQAGWYH